MMDSPDSIDGLFGITEMDESCGMSFNDEPNWLEELIKNPVLADDFLNSTGSVFDLDLDAEGQPMVYTEHSYSVSQGDLMGTVSSNSTISSSLEQDADLESALLTLVDPNLVMTPEDSVITEATEYMDYYTTNNTEYIDYTSSDADSQSPVYDAVDELNTNAYISNSVEENINLNGNNSTENYVSTEFTDDNAEYCDITTSGDLVEISHDTASEIHDSFMVTSSSNARYVPAENIRALSSNTRYIPASNIKTSSASLSSVASTSATTSLPASTIVLTYQPNNAIRVSGKTPTIIVTKSTQSGLMVRQAATLPVGFVRLDSSARNKSAVASSSLVKTEPAEKPVILTTAIPSGNTRRDVDTSLPPSPPNSDSEGMSPRADHPPSPPRQFSSGGSSPLLIQRQRGSGREAVVSILNPSVTQVQRTSNGYRVSPTGRLILTEEERRTLISEGYPVPTRLPLSKQEEMNLKKIQRKIKNKMSAQESRRKKKDYLDSLEKKLEISNSENQGLKKQLEALQSDNKSLQAQINKLQQLANRLKPSIETSTCVMVFVLFFAMFTSTFLSPAFLINGQVKSAWSAMSGSAGASLGQNFDNNLRAINDDYQTPNMKSRTLMSTVEDPPDDPSHSVMFPSCYLLHWLSGKAFHDDIGDSEPLSTVQPPNHQLIIESKVDRIIGTAQTPSVHKHGTELSADGRGSDSNGSMFEATATAADIIVYTTSGAANLSETPELRTIAV